VKTVVFTHFKHVLLLMILIMRFFLFEYLAEILKKRFNIIKYNFYEELIKH